MFYLLKQSHQSKKMISDIQPEKFSFQLLLLLIECTQIKIKPTYKRAYLVFGLPLVGKTTISHHLAGNKLIPTKVDGAITFQVRNDLDIGDAIIRNKNDHQTYIPNIFEVKDDLALIDYPTIQQSNGCFLPLWEAYLKQKVFRSVQKMKYIIILSYQSIIRRNPHEVLEIFTQFFKLIPEIDIEQHAQIIKKHICIIINEVPAEDQGKFAIKCLKNIKFKNHPGRDKIFSQIKSQVIKYSRIFLFYEARSNIQLTLSLSNIQDSNWVNANVFSPQRSLQFSIKGGNEKLFKEGYASMIGSYRQNMHQSHLNIRHFFEIFIDLPQLKDLTNLIIQSNLYMKKQTALEKNKVYENYVKQYKQRKQIYGRQLFKKFNNCFIIELQGSLAPIQQNQIPPPIQIISAYLKLVEIFKEALVLGQPSQQRDEDFYSKLTRMLIQAFGIIINLMKIIYKDIEIEEFCTAIILRITSCLKIYHIFERQLKLLPQSDRKVLIQFPNSLLKIIQIDNSKLYTNLMNFCERLDLNKNYQKKAIYFYLIDVFQKINRQVRNVPEARFAFYKMCRQSNIYWQYFLSFSILTIQVKITQFQLYVDHQFVQACKNLIKLEKKNCQYFDKLSNENRFSADNHTTQKQYLKKSQGISYRILQYLSSCLRSLHHEQIAIKIYQMLNDASEVEKYYEKKERQILDNYNQYNQEQTVIVLDFYQRYIQALVKFQNLSEAAKKAKKAYHISQVLGDIQKMLKFGNVINDLESSKRKNNLNPQHNYCKAITNPEISIVRLLKDQEVQIKQKIQLI